jgi:putative FmdB family regulatory protein
MPLYEYQCRGCQKVHEVVQKFSDAPLSECPECQGPVEKLMSLSSFALKGSGWYTTDYKRSGSGKSETAAAGGSAGSSTASSSSSGSASPAPAKSS